MSTTWLSTMKPSFQTQWLALPPKESHQILEKINLLTQDPTPDGKMKKQLKHMGGKLHRLRSGDFRIIYTFEQPYISLLDLRRRDESTYDDDLDEGEFLGGLDPHLEGPSKGAQPNWEQLFAPPPKEKRRLPEPITADLLLRLRIPKAVHARLIPLQTQEDLLDCPGVPDDMLLTLNDYLFERPLIQVLQQPDYLIGDVADLLRFKEGELLGFLLKLAPEQEKYVNWALTASGPTLVKGGPGTGKSTIALYRVRSLLALLRKGGKAEPRILFTTYTNALIKSSEQLLRQLLGDDARFVEVKTADSIARSLLIGRGHPVKFAESGTLNALLRKAIAQPLFEGSALQQAAQRQSLDRLSADYLRQEIGRVIVARQITTLEQYLEAPRPGRKVQLNATQRTAVWRVHETLTRLLEAAGLETWHQVRARAAAVIAAGENVPRYDAVVVDEAQDLDPSALWLLIELCQAPHRIFITADANQSIYGSGFTWTDVHACLKFQGRTSVLQANFRSTREIGEAAHSYLVDGVLDEPGTQEYVHSGPLPAVRAVKNGSAENDLLARFLPGAAREFRLGLGSCAVLCPTEQAGRAIAGELAQRGIEATFMSGQDLNLTRPGVKVLTLNSSKGLEFPIVALAGFTGSTYPIIPPKASAEEREEILARERRTMFVGMTRAMRALLVIVPAQTKSPLLTGFANTAWNG